MPTPSQMLENCIYRYSRIICQHNNQEKKKIQLVTDIDTLKKDMQSLTKNLNDIDINKFNQYFLKINQLYENIIRELSNVQIENAIKEITSQYRMR